MTAGICVYCGRPTGDEYDEHEACVTASLEKTATNPEGTMTTSKQTGRNKWYRVFDKTTRQFVTTGGDGDGYHSTLEAARAWVRKQSAPINFEIYPTR